MMNNMFSLTNMSFDDIRKPPKYTVFNCLDYLSNQIAFDIRIEEGIFKNSIITFKYNIMLADLYKYSYTKIFYKGIMLKNFTLYEYNLSHICNNILLQTLV